MEVRQRQQCNMFCTMPDADALLVLLIHVEQLLLDLLEVHEQQILLNQFESPKQH